MDAVDAVLVDIEEAQFSFLHHTSMDVPAELKQDIQRLSHPGEDSIALLGSTDIAVADLFATCCLTLLDKAGVTAESIQGIGSHGQTIRHQPRTDGRSQRFSLQIGDPNVIAVRTGITTVADFRRKDVALGGEGAPLVPAFHEAIFQSASSNRVIVNIGGIANVTWVPSAAAKSHVTGFDTGPGNCLMDAWIQRHQDKQYDGNGDWARTGQTNFELLAQLLAEPYLLEPPPKSTGKELFNLSWLDRLLAGQNLAPADVQATLCLFTARSIASSIKSHCPTELDEVFVCGGGVFNEHLLSLLQQELAGIPIASTSACGVHPQQVEAAAFAWLAHRTLNHLSGNLPAVTGAQRRAILGGIYLP